MVLEDAAQIAVSEAPDKVAAQIVKAALDSGSSDNCTAAFVAF
jgi:serine/threonine protein phosphatase PrpC